MHRALIIRRLKSTLELISPKSDLTTLGNCLRAAPKMDIVPISALQDNYMYVIVDKASGDCAVVDPVEPHKVLAHIAEQKLNLTRVLTTHHHWDHANGNPELLTLLGKNIPVHGADDRIPALSHKVAHNDRLNIGSLKVTCLFTPCHTTGHICYYVQTDEREDSAAVFTGDTLFIGGCGRFFEGTAEQMYQNLIKTLGSLPAETRVFCGHEYSVSNLKYALHVEPANEDAKKRLRWSEEQRAAGRPTVPSTIGDEFKFNPFMRVHEKSVQAAKGVEEPVAVMHALRKEKDTWKPT